MPQHLNGLKVDNVDKDFDAVVKKKKRAPPPWW